MGDLRKLAHLREQLGEDRFSALISSDNTGKVKAFSDSLVNDAMPTSFTVGDRTYDMISFLWGNEWGKEKLVVGHTMVARAKQMSAHLGEDDGRYLLDNQQDIPVVLRGKVIFVFTDWLYRSGGIRSVFLVLWDDHDCRWVCNFGFLDKDWGPACRVLRRRK